MNIRKIDESSEAFHLLARTGLTQTASITLGCGEVTSDDFNTHPHSDQIVLVLEGELLAEVGGEREVLRPRESLIIPAGVKHRLRNQARKRAFAFTIYAPPAYPADDPN
jgi:mannose-6-phosphate isomerase-like protein (cupin superfamily)